MPEQKIKCPKCGANIPLTEVLTKQIENTLRTQLQAEHGKKAQELEQEKQVLTKKAKDLEAQAQAVDERVAEQLRTEREKIAEEVKAKILLEHSQQTKALEEELKEKRKLLTEANEKELGLLKKHRELEEKAEALDLEVERKLAAERKKIVEEAGAKATEEQLLKLREKDDKIEAMTRTINDLKRKAEQGSQEAQGEALEGALQDLLQQTFPFDKLEEVKKGQRGADILQIVRNPAGKECGKILWESKHTKEFSNKWIEKLKGDQQDAGAEIAAIVSVALPKDIRGFGFYEAIWLTDFESCCTLATALRFGLIKAAREKALAANQDTLKDVIYKYVTGQEFAMQIRAIADAFIRMKEELDKEKRAMERIWKSREKQLETVISNIGGIRGSLEGYLGPKALPTTEQFALDAVPNEEQDHTDATP